LHLQQLRDGAPIWQVGGVHAAVVAARRVDDLYQLGMLASRSLEDALIERDLA